MAKIPKVSGNTMIKYLIKKGFSIKAGREATLRWYAATSLQPYRQETPH